MADLPNRSHRDAFQRVDVAFASYKGRGGTAALDDAVLGLPALRGAAQGVLEAVATAALGAKKDSGPFPDAAYDWARDAAAMAAWAAKALRLANRVLTYAQREGITYDGAFRRAMDAKEAASAARHADDLADGAASLADPLEG